MTTVETEVLDRLLDPIRDCLTKDVAARIAGLRAPPDVQARLDDLAERHAEGLLTAAEEADYDALVRAGALIAVLQAKARSVVNGAG